jgi:dihydroorotase
MTNSDKYDLLLKGGHVIDPANGIDEQRDVAIKDGKIAEVAVGIDTALASQTVDAGGLHITPGLIDLHTHHFGKHAHINPDVYAMPAGVTTVVDAGTPGADSFEEYVETVINPTTTRVLALINICRSGMINHSEQDVTQLQAGPCAAVMRQYPDQIVGIKAAHFDGLGYAGIEAAVEAGESVGKPVMVDYHRHPSRNYRGLLERMRPGDTHTHMYGRHTPQMDENWNIYDFLLEARERGIQFDVGHGGFSFWFSSASKLIPQGHIPNTISTDVHMGSYFMLRATMPMVMSKLMNMGISLHDVVKMSTSAPASWMKRHELGNLSIGAEADVAVFEVEHGNFGFVDSGQARMEGNTRLTCHITVRSGEVVWDLNGLSRPDYRGKGDYISLNRDMSEYSDWTGYDNS